MTEKFKFQLLCNDAVDAAVTLHYVIQPNSAILALRYMMASVP